MTVTSHTSKITQRAKLLNLEIPCHNTCKEKTCKTIHASQVRRRKALVVGRLVALTADQYKLH